MDLMAKVEQALIAVEDERKLTDKLRRNATEYGAGPYAGSSAKFSFPDDYARALVRALNHEGLAIVSTASLTGEK